MFQLSDTVVAMVSQDYIILYYIIVCYAVLCHVSLLYYVI